MTDKIVDDGGAAFPIEGGVDSGLHADPGMRLRDWFAGQAMHFVLESTTIDDAQQGAEMAYMVADAMLAAREK